MLHHHEIKATGQCQATLPEHPRANVWTRLLVGTICSLLITLACVYNQDVQALESLQVEHDGYIVDNGGQMTITMLAEDPGLVWSPLTDEPVSVARHGNVWLRLRINMPRADSVFIESKWNIPIEHALLYELTPNPGDGLVPDRLHASLFHLNLSQGSHVFVMLLADIGSRSIKPRIEVSSAGDYALARTNERQAIVFLYGFAVSMLLLCFGMLLISRQPMFLYYIIYSISLIWMLAIGTFHLPNSSVYLWRILGLTSGLSIYLFMTAALELKRYTPKLHRLMLLTTYFFTIFALADLILHVNMHADWIQAALTFMAVSATILRMKQGSRAAIFLFAGWSIFALGWAISGYGLYYSLPKFAGYSAYVGYAIESLLFAMGILFESKQSESRALAHSEHALDQLSKVFYPHQIDQIRKGAILEATMPVGEANACVICFDIVGSSQIKHERHKEFLQDVFSRCDDIMSEHYDPDLLRANAFRIKQVGDGFICSVGYPFASLTGSMANDAVAIALRFFEAFTAELGLFQYHDPIHCCIGIAMDQIASFFPSAGTKSYDLYGRGIVLATRYEAMRKQLFTGEAEYSSLIIQERVYASLPTEQRLRFERTALDGDKLFVRDDPAARCLFVAKLQISKERPSQ